MHYPGRFRSVLSTDARMHHSRTRPPTSPRALRAAWSPNPLRQFPLKKREGARLIYILTSISTLPVRNSLFPNVPSHHLEGKGVGKGAANPPPPGCNYMAQSRVARVPTACGVVGALRPGIHILEQERAIVALRGKSCHSLG